MQVHSQTMAWGSSPIQTTVPPLPHLCHHHVYKTSSYRTQTLCPSLYCWCPHANSSKLRIPRAPQIFFNYADFDGSNMFILSGLPAESTSHPFDIALFEDWIYWTEWNFPSIHRAKKFTGQDYEKVLELGVRPYEIQIFHPSQQTQATENPCGTNNGGCSHLCLIAYGGKAYTCACPDLFVLESDNKTCNATCDNTYQHFKCADNSKCIPAYWKCDGQTDCADGSDEAGNLNC
ncbi:putative low-density lipoprotein receptor-related protein 2-like, partial [Apostichopus japonicus]